MCSILLIFLIFAVVFDFVKDFALSFDIEKEGTQKPCQSETCLVPAPDWYFSLECEVAQASFQGSKPPSFERFSFLARNQKRNGRLRRFVSMALRNMSAPQQEVAHDLSEMQCPLELWRETSNRTQGWPSVPSDQLEHLGELGQGLEAVGGESVMAAATTAFCLETEDQKPTCKERQNQRRQKQRIRQGQTNPF